MQVSAFARLWCSTVNPTIPWASLSFPYRMNVETLARATPTSHQWTCRLVNLITSYWECPCINPLNGLQDSAVVVLSQPRNAGMPLFISLSRLLLLMTEWEQDTVPPVYLSFEIKENKCTNPHHLCSKTLIWSDRLNTKQQSLRKYCSSLERLS